MLCDTLMNLKHNLKCHNISLFTLTLLPPSVFLIYILYMYKHTNAVVRNVEPNDWAWQDFGCSCCRFPLPFRTLDVTLDLKDPHYPNHDLGSLELAVTLIPKEGDFREAVSFYLFIYFCYVSVFHAGVFELWIWSGVVRSAVNCGFIQMYKNSMNCTFVF